MPGDGPLVGALTPPPAPGIVADEAEVEVRVDIGWRSDLIALPPRPACRVWNCDQEVPAPEVEWLAGSAALPLVEHRAGDQQLIRVRAQGRETMRLVRLRADGVDLRLGPDVLVRGRVVDARGEGLAAAVVWAAGVETKTDADGEFEVSVVGGEGVPLVTWADGMAAQTLVLETFCNSTVRVVLQPGAHVRLRAVGAVATGAKPARVYVLPAREPRTSTEAQYPFFLQSIRGGEPLSARGLASLSHLPIGGRFRFLIAHDEMVADTVPSSEARGRPTEVTVLLARGAIVRGKVRDTAGHAVPGAFVAAWPEDSGELLQREPGAGCALPAPAYAARGSFTRSADDGSFTFARSPRFGAVRLATVASTWAVEVALRGALADVEQDLMLPGSDFDATAGDARLRLCASAPGRYRVRVVEEGKQPRPAASWTGTVPFPIPLRSAAVVDVKVTLLGRDGRHVCALPSLPIVDVVDVALPAEPIVSTRDASSTR